MQLAGIGFCGEKRSQIERVVNRHDDAGRGTSPRDFLHGNGIGHIIQTGATCRAAVGDYLGGN